MSNEGWTPGERVVVQIGGQRVAATIHDARGAGPIEHTPMVLVDLPALRLPCLFSDGDRTRTQPAGQYWVDPERVSRAVGGAIVGERMAKEQPA